MTHQYTKLADWHQAMADEPKRNQARVYLAQARVRRHQHAFHATLLMWAANARRSVERTMT